MDPQQQQQITGMMAGFGAAIGLIWLLVLAFLVFLFWRIFTKAGMAGALSLIALIPGFGLFICLCILAFSEWRTSTLGPGYSSGAPPYPPTYPPSGYPPSGPSSQL